jgi:2-phosphosulfolactate phosphatase
MVKGRYGRTLVVASFVNLSAVTDLLLSLQSDFVIICAGHENRFCLEDALAAGKLLNRMATRHGGELILDDAGRAAVSLDRSLGKNLDRVLRTSEHGRFLAEIGFAADLDVCGAVDSVPVLPLMAGNVIKLAKENGKRS